MKKLIKKMKGKKVLSLVLVAIMLATTFNIALPMLKLDASAAGSITTQDGAEIITQTQIVDSSTRTTTYESYATQFLDGASRPLDIVIPGLDPAQDYVIQGMTYYPGRDWMLVTAYHNYDSDNDTTQYSSKVFALDAATGEFVAMFSFLNVDGSTNVDHGGGIAVSEHNIYYACGDADRKIAYAPVSALENAVEGQHTIIQLAGEREFTEVGSVTSDSKTAYTAYVCYDDGILWTGNFYDPGVKILGVSVAATDYSVPANDDYKSMVFGYELKGDSSEEEWNNLIGATGTDCQGNPSYSIGLNNAIKDVQYATVDNGKLYLSCSFGTGEGTNSVTLGGMRPYSQLIVADIDLSIAGTKTVSIATNTSGGTASVLAHDIQDYTLYDMMPMSEGLCVIEDKIYITFESASNKYLNEAGALTGNCEYPIDVIWELDPYALMEIEKAEPENSIYYEKVNGHADIVDGEEYIIVYESDEEDPVTQQKILYVFNSDGNFKGHKLSKSSADNLKGYDGMIGHPITEYSILKAGEQDALGNTYSRDILYLDNQENDDIESVRWTITNISGTTYTIKTTETYFANCNSFYFDASRITMLPTSATTLLSTIDIGQLVADNGYFYLSNNGAYLWCNDGLNDTYNTNANAYYAANASTTPIYSGLTETPGTIHCNALGSDLTGGSGVPAAEDGKKQAYPDGAFQIYRRVTDSAASTYESRVYTDLNAELQADGTYTVDLETYAISPNHYQYVGERPTDYILVADTSSSMSNNSDSTGVIAYSSTDELSVETLSGSTDDTADTNGVGVIGYGFSDPAQDIYFKHTDGEYYKIYLAVNTVEFKDYVVTTSIKQRYWAYYVTNDGMYNVLQTSGICGGSDGGVFDPISREDFINHVDNSSSLGDDSQYSAYSTKSSNSNRRSTIVYKGAHYRFTTSEEFTRLSTIQTVANDLIDDIAAQNSDNRIALVQYGADASSGFYNTSSTFTQSDYTNAFFSASAKDSVKTLVSNLTTTTQTSNSGIEMDYVNALISNSGVDYKATGDRNVVVIFMSDGIPGADDDNSAITTAANAVISKALTAKENGAFIYSVLTGQASVSGFNKKTYMEAVSTKYAAAAGMGDDKIGGQSIDGVNYIINLSSCTIDTYTNFGEVAMDEVVVNTAVGLANLDASAILRQELSDSFIIPTDKEPQVSFIEGKFDAIGRFSFAEDSPTTATGVTVNWNAETPELLTVTGYDYSSQYISKGKTGNKLRIRITGVLADETKTIQNTPVSNTATTALYQTSADMTDTGGNAFKYLPTVYFNIPKYTYVLDYGLQLLDTDVNGTLKAVSAGITKQDVNNYIRKSENGLVAIADNSLDLLYHTTPTNTTDSGYVLIQRDSGKYDWFEIEVVPASNVYFEETEFATDAGTGTVEWATATGGTSATYRDLPDDGDVDGYDNAYDNTNTYSNGTTLSASVDSTNKRSKTATVSFAGNGIDIVSACGPTTGMQIINIKNADGKSVAASIVDTYYADNTFSQVPIFSWRGDYGKYTVETTAVYLSTAGALKKSSIKNSLVDTGLVMNSSDALNTANVQAMLDAAGIEDIDAENLELVWFDDNSVLNGGSGVAPTKKGARSDSTGTVTLENYIDGFRIYNPLGSDSSSYKESEQDAVYYNIIDSLADGTLSDGSLDFTSGTVAFVTGTLADGETLSFSNYESIGPENELYLQGGASSGVTFNTSVATNGRVMISLRAVNGATTVKINGSDPISVTSATEMYYDITDLLTVTNNVANVTIINSGSGILAVNNIKLTNTAATTGLMLLSSDDLDTVQYYATMEPVEVTVKNGVVTPVTEEEEVPEDNTDTENNDTTTESGESEEFSIFSLIEILIAFIENILRGAFGSGNLF